MKKKFEYKLVIVVREDLKLSMGKIAVQVAHAAVSCAINAQKNYLENFRAWFSEGQKKVVLKVKNEPELFELKNKALNENLPCEVIHDAGLTEVPPNTVTCIGIGPAPEKNVDKVTGDLPLL